MPALSESKDLLTAASALSLKLHASIAALVEQREADGISRIALPAIRATIQHRRTQA